MIYNPITLTPITLTTLTYTQTLTLSPNPNEWVPRALLQVAVGVGKELRTSR